MNTLEELVYYCREPEPVGALLLTGEWGCGKTYFIDHNLKDELRDEAYVLRISLFGITSLEEIHSAVKMKWMEAFCEKYGINSVVKKVEKGRKMLGKIDCIPKFIKEMASTDWTSFILVKEKIDDKSVILVFDDLERCQMNHVDVLGVINDYCENQKFHTIIVANQEKIDIKQEKSQINAEIEFDGANQNSNSKKKHYAALKIDAPCNTNLQKIPYAEIREKIIHRTLKYVPDYKAIVHAVITNMKYQDRETHGNRYKEFVEGCESGLLEIFAPDRNVSSNVKNGADALFEGADITNNDSISDCYQCPHNIRSLKCAISDFYRVYRILVKNDFSDIDRWFYCFTSYVISYKAGIAIEDHYGTIISDGIIMKLYPEFQTEYIFKAVKKWILHGIWDEAAVNYEIEIIKQREKAITPVDVVRTNHIINVEDTDLEQGFKGVLDLAYDGALSLDDYIRFINNSYWLRTHGFSLPNLIEWNKVQNGIRKCINNLMETDSEEQPLYTFINKTDLEKFIEDERDTYQIIEDFINGDVLMFERNRKCYIDGMKENPIQTLLILEKKKFHAFDREMAFATADAFRKEINAEKSQFKGYFYTLWRGSILSTQDIDVEESIIGLNTLHESLSNFKIELQNENKVITEIHTTQFIELVTELTEKLKKKVTI